MRAATATVFDAVIVGAGPAGSCAALTLARAGARTLLLEREPLPRYKTCGGGVLARALAWLPEPVAVQPQRDVYRAELHLPVDGLQFALCRPRPMIHMTMRDEFDLALARAAERAGADLRAGVAVVELRHEASHVAVRTDGGTHRARMVLGTDGALGCVARQAGWADVRPGIPALECELPVEEATLRRFEHVARFDLGTPEDGYAWVFPKRDHLSVGVLCMHRRGAKLKAALHEYLARLDIRGSVLGRLHGFQIPLGPRPDGFARGRVLLAGDAAALADPITAEGISNAIRSGRLAAESLLAADFEPRRAAARYRRALGREVLPELRAARWLAHLLYELPPLRTMLFRRFGQEFCEAMADVIVGQTSYRDLLASPSNYGRLLRRLLRPGRPPTQAAPQSPTSSNPCERSSAISDKA